MRIRIRIVFFAFIVMLSLTGCGIGRMAKVIYNVATGSATTSKEKATILCEQLFESVQNRDEEQLKSLFCKKLQEKPGLDEEIETFFNFIDGEIVSYDEPEGFDGSASSTPEDGYVIFTISGEVRNIETDTGNTYTILYIAYSIYKSDESRLGITGVQVIDEGKRVAGEALDENSSLSILL